MAARVRADLLTVGTACGLTCNGDFNWLFFDMMSLYNNATSLCQPVLTILRPFLLLTVTLTDTKSEILREKQVKSDLEIRFVEG